MFWIDILEFIANLLDRANIRSVLVGGLAVNYYHYTRQTNDIDFLIATNDAERAIEELKRGGFSLIDRYENFVRFKPNDPHHKPVDLLFVDKHTLDQIIGSASKLRLIQKEIYIPSLEYLIALKLHAIKNNRKWRELKDLLDIVELIKINNVDTKTPKFKELCLKYGTEQDYKKIREVLE